MRAGAAAMLALAAASCATVAKAAFSQPVVTLHDVRLTAVGFDGGTLQVVLGVWNPNDFDLDASSVTYQVMVDSSVVGSGASQQRILIPARDSAVVRLPVSFNWAGAGAAGQQLMRNGSVLYEVKGAMRIASGVGTITLPYDQRGRFSAPAGSR